MKFTSQNLGLIISCIIVAGLLSFSKGDCLIIDGTITGDITYTINSCAPCTLQNATYKDFSHTMTFAAGCSVVVNSDGYLVCDSGTVKFGGTSESPIIFTPNTGSPTRGYWDGITFNGGTVSTTYDGSGNYSSGSYMNYTTIEYADIGIKMDSCSVGIRNSDIVFDFIGIRADDVLLLKVHDSKISRNGLDPESTTDVVCGGIFVYNTKVDIENCHIDSNTYYRSTSLGLAAGITLRENSFGLIENCDLNYNRVTGIALHPINQDHYAASLLINSRGDFIPKAECGATLL